MRFSRIASVERSRTDTKLVYSRARKKHKRLDEVCEETYNQNHNGVDKVETSEWNGEESEVELRRSSRVRKTPVVLDASPPPARKRQKIDRSGVRSGSRLEKGDVVKVESPCSTSNHLEEGTSSWGLRLRARSKRTTNRVRNSVDSSPVGKRKIFQDVDELKEETELEVGELDKEEDSECEKSTIVKSKRPGRIKASNVMVTEQQETGTGGGVEDGKMVDQEELLHVRDETYDGISTTRFKEGVEDGNVALPLDNEDKAQLETCVEPEECHATDQVSMLEQDLQRRNEVSVGVIDQKDGVEGGLLPNDEKDGGTEKQAEDEVDRVDYAQEKDGGTEEQAEDEVDRVDYAQEKDEGVFSDKALEMEKVVKKECASDSTLRKRRIREGRHCGLCGGGTDGKPPKKLVYGAASDDEAHSGSSASDEPNYDMWDGFGDEPGWLGRLLGPINDRYGIAGIWVHQQCAVWSPEVYFAGLGCLKNVRAALCRGRVLKCSRCGRPGATIGCRVDRCPKTYHLPCARANGCIFDHRKFLIACTDHRHLFQPYGSNYLQRIKKLKARKMKFELRKLSNDALRKDVDAEEKWLENCGEDEEFLKRESKRLHRDLLRIAPVYIGGSNSDAGVQFQGWDSVAGLQDVIQCMKEVVILPLLYPELFSSLGLTPPRGVLLHGYPGTGKTLIVRALIGSCARGDKRIAYFARKGADCLGKYVGDAERQLRLLFQVAEKSQPSVIFFDEIDGLAPCRGRQQDQTHSSVVSTLLALMDGLKPRGSVVVIGATNRPDAVDPALRRPGRFDREIYFPLPSVKDRESILSLHTKKWPKPVSGPVLKWIASKTVGFAGADLQALCTQAAIIALKRSFPLHKRLSAVVKVPNAACPPLPNFKVEERDWVEALTCAPPPCSRREAGMAANDVVSAPLHTFLVPCLLQPLSRLIVSLYLDERLWLPPLLFKAAEFVKDVVLSAMVEKKLPSNNWQSYVNDLLQEPDVISQIENHFVRANILDGDANIGGFDAVDDGNVHGLSNSQPSKLQWAGARPKLLKNIFHMAGKKSGFRILISGNPRSGQRHLASSLLHCFVGNVDVQKVDLATISQEGHGDVIQGLTQILMRCASVEKCMIFMPRVDLWAMETSDLVCPEDGCSLLNPESLGKDEERSFNHSADQAGDALKRASYLWSSFVEQVESICMATSVMLLATSDVPLEALPVRVRQFFKSQPLNSSIPFPLEDSVSRFSEQLDRNFDQECLIDSSAAKLSKDIAQHFIQLIHRTNHVHLQTCNDEASDKSEGDAAIECQRSDLRSTIEPVNKQCPLPTSAIANSRNVKGKSNLMLAITTFGYQILRYPHFAELCWFTSKLREGPCVDINGPWKGWPFNSCVIRPIISTGNVTLPPNNNKGKEKYCMVRGLIAIGLLAYRGKYSSVREVSAEVRKVLELLVEQINDKIRNGRDRYQFVRLLSQVAYLDDMVNSWVYSLQSLGGDSQLAEANPKIGCAGLPESADAPENTPLREGGCELEEPLDKAETLETCRPELTAENCTPANPEANGVSNFPDIGAVEHEPLHLVAVNHSAPSRQVTCSVHSVLNDNSCMPDDTDKHLGNIGDSVLKRQSNGLMELNIDDVQEDGNNHSRDGCGIDEHSNYTLSSNSNGRLSTLNNLEIGDSNQKSVGNNIGLECSNISSNLSTDSSIVCLYRCCPQCLLNLQRILKKMLSYEWGLKKAEFIVEDAYDFLASLAANLHSALRVWLLADDSTSFYEKRIQVRYSESFECKQTNLCECRNLENKLIKLIECNCHLKSSVQTEKCKSSQNLSQEFIFRDGVLTNLDEKDVSTHCKFETLCLCSLVEWIVMRKKTT
ncbi:uncharacterized protein LOC125839189 [Solanum verrucosum]|uniref:uncharacterized protein LOC125839189 n=1 Tax=Solanum verrucosum TaxID=315347 RepID=UPI0020D1E4F2|nr:uncharacterized protein LOC125839189 [Solanum verrucosum]